MGIKLILLGAPGAGKGTQAAILSEKLGVPSISTGTMLRTAIRNGTPVGQKAKSYMDAGQLVPDAVVMDIVVERLANPDCERGYILDGVPRTIVQAEVLEAAGVVFDRVLSIEIADETIEKRMTGRRVCDICGTPYHLTAKPPKKQGICDACGGELIQRDDDKPAMVKARLEVYHNETEPLKHFYAERGILVSVANRPDIESMTAAMLEALQA